jgi:serine/threonine-protein kinase HipA
MKKATPKWKELLAICFISNEMKQKYLELLEIRLAMF